MYNIYWMSVESEATVIVILHVGSIWVQDGVV